MNSDLKEIKSNMLKMAHYSHASHIGAALSCVDLLYCIYKNFADITSQNVFSIDRDKVILSKGHASIALYAVLAEFGLLDKEKLKQYYIDGGVLPGHLDKDSEAAVDCSAGSLGHGLPIAIGMALANPKRKVFVIMGDGEIQEGSVWEGIIFAGKNPLKNLTIVIDKNNLQAFGKTTEVANYSSLKSTFNNFGLDAYEIDGHNISEIYSILDKKSEKTKIIIANTIKGHGISFMENQLKWHYKSPNDEELEKALKEVNK